MLDAPADTAAAAAAWLARSLRAAIARRGRASVAFSGGSTPAEMLKTMATTHLDWNRVDVFQVDERIVPDGDPRRNANMLSVLPVPAANLVLMPVAVGPTATACADYARRLPARFDVVHLGLGDDGHTASWVPGDDVVNASADVAISSIYQGTQRMTLTPRPINHARRRMVLVAGDSKAVAFAKWMLDDGTLPVSRLRRGQTIVFADRAAAAQVPLAH